uniref:ribonuclease P n=1 Tax=Rhizochromulina marina TaxID=1034831 RepID=A0A7S2SWH3_9STRA
MAATLQDSAAGGAPLRRDKGPKAKKNSKIRKVQMEIAGCFKSNPGPGAVLSVLDLFQQHVDAGDQLSSGLYEQVLNLLAIYEPAACIDRFEAWEPLTAYSEACFFACVSSCLALGDVYKAVQVLEDVMLPQIEQRPQLQPRARTFTFVITELCKRGDLSTSGRLWLRMTQEFGLDTPEECYEAMICALVASVGRSAAAWEQVTATDGSPLAQQGADALLRCHLEDGLRAQRMLASILHRMAWTLPVLKDDTLDRIHACCMSSGREKLVLRHQLQEQDSTDTHCRNSQSTNNLTAWRTTWRSDGTAETYPSVDVVSGRLGKGAMTASVAATLSQQAVMEVAAALTEPRVRPLTDAPRSLWCRWTALDHNTVSPPELLPVLPGLVGLSARERQTAAQALRAAVPANLDSFTEWLDANPRKNFTVVVDAANIGYCRQNFEGGHFDVEQISLLVDELQDRGEECLIIMPTKYTEKIVPNHVRHAHRGSIKLNTRLTGRELSILRRWDQAEKRLFRVPRFENDDWYWIYATLLDAGPESPVLRVVTNDMIRDHWRDILDPIAFDRWKHTQVQRYDIDPCDGVKDDEEDNDMCLPAAVLVEAPALHSRMSQCSEWHSHTNDPPTRNSVGASPASPIPTWLLAGASRALILSFSGAG